jgi:hypothetical protein
LNPIVGEPRSGPAGFTFQNLIARRRLERGDFAETR